MKFLFWNIRGLGKPARKRQLKELIFKERLDAVGVQETFKKDFSACELKGFAGRFDFDWHWVPAQGHSRGMLLGVRKELLETEGKDQGRFLSVCL